MDTLESIVHEGKKVIAAASMALIFSCTPAVRARKDYDRYPARKAEIALYNMQQIAGQICGTPQGLEGELYYRCQQMNFSQQGLEYVSTDCSHFMDTKDVACGSIKHQSYSMSWDDIRKIIPIGDSIKVCTEGEGCITVKRFKNNQQAVDFAEAMNIYVMER